MKGVTIYHFHLQLNNDKKYKKDKEISTKTEMLNSQLKNVKRIMQKYPNYTTKLLKKKWKFALFGSKMPVTKEVHAHLHTHQDKLIEYRRDCSLLFHNKSRSSSWQKGQRQYLRITWCTSKLEDNNKKWQSSLNTNQLPWRTIRIKGMRIRHRIFHNSKRQLDSNKVKFLRKKHKFVSDLWEASVSLDWRVTNYTPKLN